MSGHGSYDKTLDRLRRMCYWPGMFSDTTAYCQSCRQCSLASNKAFHSPLTPVLSNGPWETVGIDILELNQSGSYRYVLVIQDYYTKWAIARPLVNQTAESVCDIMVDVFAIFGTPKRIHSDQGRNFESWAFQNLCKTFGIAKSRTTSYHPQGNGLVERTNRSIINILRKISETQEWHKILQIVLYCYNTAIHSSIKVSPYQALFGRLPYSNIWDPNNKLYDFWTNLRENQINRARIFDMIECELNESGAKEKLYYDTRNRVEYRPFRINRNVYRRIHRTQKTSQYWESGWKVVKDLGKTVELFNQEKSKTIIVNKDRVKPDHDRIRIHEPGDETWEFSKPFKDDLSRRYPLRYRRPAITK
ncbi:Transposon Tf2-6 polyprotein [Thelohanellus kitauei]|uniref:Transposon Tf2-6 polyprotein n=1 Tax=Thelohanellus kitauei TaxID=669202 RepID=A0A0C2MFW3_THEKT|nr:Transposon Tf2-6 polyprotein [Thelohanellus kitauei]